MAHLDPRVPTGAPAPPDGGPGGSPRRETGFNWRISVGMFVGLAILFGVLFGLRALHIFQPEPGQDAGIADARAAPAPQPAAAATPEAQPPLAAAAATTQPVIAPTAAANTAPTVQPNPTEVQ